MPQIQLIDIYRVYEALQQLEDEGKIVGLPGGRYVTVKAAVRRWLKENFVEIGIPDYLVRDIEWTMKLKSKRHYSLEAFILDALREHIAKVKEIYEGCGSRRETIIK
ncbi:MAG: hypothetical protein QXU02_01840 [Candidatus Bathyarchaeia archaeon]